MRKFDRVRENRGICRPNRLYAPHTPGSGKPGARTNGADEHAASDGGAFHAPALDKVRVIGDEALRERECIPAPVDFDACRHSLLLSAED